MQKFAIFFAQVPSTEPKQCTIRMTLKLLFQRGHMMLFWGGGLPSFIVLCCILQRWFSLLCLCLGIRIRAQHVPWFFDHTTLLSITCPTLPLNPERQVMCMHNSHQRLDGGEMSHSVAKMNHLSHNVKRDSAAMHQMRNNLLGRSQKE